MHLQGKGEFPEDVTTFRCNTIAREGWGAFAVHPESIRLTSATGDISTSPPFNSGLASAVPSLYSPAETFKSTKRDANLFPLFKESKFQDN